MSSTAATTVPAPYLTGRTAARRTAARDTDAVAASLLTLLADLPAGGVDRDRIRTRLIELHVPLARYLAQRYRNRGEPLEDLVQVASLGLVKAVDGFDAGRGVAFPAYAIPMIVG